jgi:hypothetical protein
MKKKYEKPVLIKYDKFENYIKDEERWGGVVSEGNLGTWSSLDCEEGKWDGGSGGCLDYADQGM